MKCPVCQTRIPLGSKECPNCGYMTKKKTVTHKQIENKEVKKVKLGVVLGVIVSLIFSAIFFNYLYEREKHYGLSSFKQTYDKPIEELVEDGMDQNHVLVDVMKYKDNLKKFLTDNGYSDFNEKEFIRKDFHKLLATYRVNCLKGNTHYTVEVTFSSEESLISTAVHVNYSHNQSMRTNPLPFPKEDLDIIAEYLDIYDAYEIFDKGRLNMELTENAETGMKEYYYYEYNDKRSIRLIEQNNTKDIYTAHLVYMS